MWSGWRLYCLASSSSFGSWASSSWYQGMETSYPVEWGLYRNLAVARFDVGDLAVAHVEDAVGDLGGLGVVGDHEDGLVELAAGMAKHLEDGVGVFSVEVAGGLVGEDDGWAVDEAAGDGYALLFAT